jgi:hypothetical protein
MRRIVGMVSLALALLLPPLAASSQNNDSAAAASSSRAGGCADEDNRQPAAVNPEYGWRLRAYDDLDCALAILDEALQAPGSVVTLPRHDAERARARVWSAKDAAARIGR